VHSKRLGRPDSLVHDDHNFGADHAHRRSQFVVGKSENGFDSGESHTLRAQTAGSQRRVPDGLPVMRLDGRLV
jgi:hypothetical protein